MEKKIQHVAYTLGYQQAITDLVQFLQSVPERHEGTPLFGQKTYQEEYEQYIKDTPIRANIRAEQIFNFSEGPKE